jgi:V/A-type H+/Na+-transporting ATPase subunit I
MSIVPMTKVSLCGRLDDKAAALAGLQGLGVVHLLPLRPPQPLAPIDPEDRRRAETAFRHIMEAQDHLRPYRSDEGFDRDGTIEQILANRRLLRQLGDRRDELRARIDGLEPWGDFTFPDPDDLAGMRLWLYPLPVKERAALDRLDLPWVVVGRGPTTLNVAVIAREEPPADALPVRRIRAGAGPLGRLRAELEGVEIAIEEAEAARASLSRWRVLLGAYLAAAQDADALREAAEQTRDEERIFAVQGWAPAECAPALAAFVDSHRLALLVEPVGRDDTPPTLLRDPERATGAADLTTFYTSPGYHSWDPSLIVFASFALFFAMIMADAGYAALIVVGTALYWRRLGRSDAGRRARTILAALAGTALAYGVLAGSYFGMAPPTGSVPATLAVIDVTDFQSMMVISVAIGALHLTIAHGAVAWLNRGRGATVLAPLGWIVVIWGGMLAWLGGETGERLGFGLVAGGLIAVFIGSSAKQAVARPRDWFKRLAAGFMGLTGITRQFGDILSYLRLFALGLASASLAGTFNMLATDLRASMPGMGLLLGILVLLIGHGITFGLGIMSGFVHGLRLNFIEFFGWGLTEEGYPFKAFAKKEAPL